MEASPVADKVLCKTYLKEALGDGDGAGLMLLISPELEQKAKMLIKVLDLKLKVEPCKEFLTGYWVIF